MKREKIQTHLQTRVLGRSLANYEETDSTNLQAQRLADEGTAHGTLVTADAQTAGRGRRGRTWASEKGAHIYMSLLLRPEIQPANASMLTLVMGLSVARACRETLEELKASGTGETMSQAAHVSVPQPQEIGIKWPNDLVWQGRKICGILTEMRMGPDGIRDIVIGVGVNVNGTHFPAELQSTAASLCMAAGRELDREILTARILNHFERDYEMFLQTEDLQRLSREYESLMVNVGREVKVLDPEKEYTGVARGINAKGELLVECADGLRTVYAGEVSVRGIYGYV